MNGGESVSELQTTSLPRKLKKRSETPFSERPLSEKPQAIKLTLEDETLFEGFLFGHSKAVSGEVVFNTGMVGYPETLTDPSYHGQILVFTYPLIGNYGVPPYKVDEFGLPLGFESEKIQAAGIIVTEYTAAYSHQSATRSLGEWLESEGVPGITGIDTRALTKRLRSKGTMLGKIETDTQKTEIVDPFTVNLVANVSPREMSVLTPTSTNGDRPLRVVLLDCGCKANIKRSLLKRNLEVIVVPHDHYFLNMDFDGLLISNGPGDPRLAVDTIKIIEHALAVGKPTLGICMGHQLLAIAAGGETYKLKYGHRSQNQPCLLTDSGGRCMITSQNHGYAVRKEKLPRDWQVWFENANDGTVEGIRHKSKPFLGVQFHPEASPGPLDTAWIFDEFAELVRECAR
ncbi:MAG: glutamine-hydrolyzing carbamoyl-phosphate synthase small subunit [candidate division Zixibacteria bacterium]|nr:glutamine-hydrolyzing carbamoyl-phosphate synthase small subunit [candidate division Zixibacteria bacterium]